MGMMGVDGMGMVGVEELRMTPSILVLVSGTNDRNRKLWRQGQDEKFGFRNRKFCTNGQ